MENRIREWRKERGLTIEELAAAVETSIQQISRLERSERRLTDGWLARIAAALSVNKADLIIERSGVAPTDCEFAKDKEEVRLLRAWRSLDDAERDVFIRSMERLAPPR